MTKIFLTILLVLSTCAVVLNGVLVYQLQATETVMAQEETSDDKSENTVGKDLGKEKIAIAVYRYQCTFNLWRLLVTPYTAFFCSTGFSLTPYNPPEVTSLFS